MVYGLYMNVPGTWHCPCTYTLVSYHFIFVSLSNHFFYFVVVGSKVYSKFKAFYRLFVSSQYYKLFIEKWFLEFSYLVNYYYLLLNVKLAKNVLFADSGVS